MFCSECGVEATGKFCWSCGKPLHEPSSTLKHQQQLQSAIQRRLV